MFRLSEEQVLTIPLLKKIIDTNKTTIDRYQKLENYYLGKHEIIKRQMADTSKPNNKIVNPYPQYISDVLSGYFLGEPITYTSEDTEAVEYLNNLLVYNDSADEDISLAKNQSIYGKAVEMLYIDADGITRIASINPKEVIFVYDDTVEADILFAIRLIPVHDLLNDKNYYNIEVYSRTDISYYKADEYFNNISVAGEPKEHYFGLVPFVEYKNNENDLGDFETIISLIDAYDKLESDTLNDFEYFVDCYLALTNVTADSEDIKAMKQNRVLLLDENSKAEWLTKASNDTSIENLKNRIKADIHKFAKVPDLSDENFASNASGVAIKYKLYGTSIVISAKERKFKKGLQRRIELIYNIEAKAGSTYDWRAIDISFTRNLPSNNTEIADIVSKLSSIVSNETLLAQIPFVTNVEQEKERIRQEKEENPLFYDSFENAFQNEQE